ncbi:hypothetical protein Taro_039354 [Colocasia esculenta]|uniref:Secreted protein n=1 Tax=Colocasia esculenta TaxID=4460 RepID=A0A843WVI7_COLES|nr:hypothetical protein [Colocasia esculenta]
MSHFLGLCRLALWAVCSGFHFAGSLGLFEVIAYLTGLNSNPSGSSDPSVAARPSGVPGGGLGGRVVTVVSELRGPTRFVMG